MNTKKDEQNPTSGLSSDISNQKINSKLAWIIGLGMLFGMIALLMFVPCPTSSQYLAFRITLAIAAGLLASQLPGMFNFESKAGVKASGAIGVFALIYLVNPGETLGDDRCNSGPFDFSIQLKETPSSKVPNTYPKLEDAILELWVDNVFRKSDALKNNTADFKSLPAKMKDRSLPIQLKAPYWKLATDSIKINGKSQTIFIEPDGSLAKITGKLIDDVKGNPVPSVTIETLSETTQTDAQGNFSLSIPLEKQREEYEVYANKENFLGWKGTATPATGAALTIVLKSE